MEKRTTRILMCLVLFEFILEALSYVVPHYNTYPNAAIAGHNIIHLTDVSPEDCATRCNNEISFTCRSFDYYKYTQKCDLSNKDKDMVGGLKTNYDGNPYDHYERLIECSSNPCFNGGVCVNGINQYTCNCPSNYQGVNCQIRKYTSN
ncbi:protein jagged-1-like [Anneissia japonica]|uniref:protein jagged-1-like n=1 Tax=Anneissia japonica TaxID=1529436 RepID=UPI0014256670|nr:protein jagged-1-like [Anneissia japonica]